MRSQAVGRAPMLPMPRDGGGFSDPESHSEAWLCPTTERGDRRAAPARAAKGAADRADRAGGRHVWVCVEPQTLRPIFRDRAEGGTASGSVLTMGRHAIAGAAISTAADWRATLLAGAAGAS